MSQNSIRLLPAICAATVVAILVAGLWPRKFSPTNEVSWLDGRNGLRFHRYGIAYSPEPVAGLWSGPGEDHPVSVEMALKADREAGRHLPRILSLYDEKNGETCFIGQWRSGIVLRRWVEETRGKRAFRETGARSAFAGGGRRLIAVVSGDSGTAVYVDGKLENFDRGLVLSAGGRRRPSYLVLGNSPDGRNPWEGEIYGLSIYTRLLTAEEVSARYKAWLNDEGSVEAAGNGPILRYRFDERAGSAARNSAGPGYGLEIPSVFLAPYRTVLAHGLRDLRLDRSSVKDIAVNVAGFIPFGCFFMAWISRTRPGTKGRAAFYVILLGFSISLAIELAQAYLPARDSSAIDVACNTLGTAAGAALFVTVPFFDGRPTPRGRQTH